MEGSQSQRHRQNNFSYLHRNPLFISWVQIVWRELKNWKLKKPNPIMLNFFTNMNENTKNKSKFFLNVNKNLAISSYFFFLLRYGSGPAKMTYSFCARIPRYASASTTVNFRSILTKVFITEEVRSVGPSIMNRWHRPEIFKLQPSKSGISNEKLSSHRHRHIFKKNKLKSRL